MKRVLGPWALCSMVAVLGFACDDDEGGGGCASDQACGRGMICEDGACKAVACTGLQSCPGTGRTCLVDIRQCSQKECADVVDGVETTCAPGASCIEDGPFRGSCVQPGGVSCGNTGDCLPLGDTYQCCEGLCAENCADSSVITPAEDMGVPPPGDGGPLPGTDMGPGGPDMGAPPGGGELCSPCAGDGECAGLGDGARCTPIGANGGFCTSACDPAGDDCPRGFGCVQGLNQCLPESFECSGCVVDGCPDGQVCDVASGDCTAPRGVCGGCGDDGDCQAGLQCAQLGGSGYCFAPCAAGGTCADGLSCEEGVCKPAGGVCDPCLGACGGATPFCRPDGSCGQCGEGVPCPMGMVCDVATATCMEPQMGGSCNSDIDCQGADLPYCFGGECVECFQSSQCPARTRCDQNWRCVAAPCEGVACPQGSVCSEQSGRCDPGCQSNNDCALPNEMGCNGETGQCYYLDGRCDLGGGDGVCAPGSQCNPGLDPNYGNCSCRKVDPMDFLSNETIVDCQPGLSCFQLAFPQDPAEPPMPVPDGFCIQSPF
ncbi:MAG: hypothetical protein H6704_16210 [Myxococcales bacterium]|nr:hypothetical protein [Myxococcales bacterium]